LHKAGRSALPITNRLDRFEPFPALTAVVWTVAKFNTNAAKK
jgi:hypothetical protein